MYYNHLSKGLLFTQYIMSGFKPKNKLQGISKSKEGDSLKRQGKSEPESDTAGMLKLLHQKFSTTMINMLRALIEKVNRD